MALKDRISIDTSGMDQNNINRYAKGVALHFNVKNPDGSIDISSLSTLNQLFKEQIAQTLENWSLSAQDYERDRAYPSVSILDS